MSDFQDLDDVGQRVRLVCGTVKIPVVNDDTRRRRRRSIRPRVVGSCPEERKSVAVDVLGFQPVQIVVNVSERRVHQETPIGEIVFDQVHAEVL